MPRTVNSTLKSWLDNNPLLESHSTLEIFLPFSEDGGSYYYSTSGEVSISGNLYLKRLKEVGELKLSLGSAADRIEVRLDNSDDTEGWLFQQSSDILIQNHVKVGRIYYNPQVPGSQYHQILFQGTIVSYQVLDTEIQLSIVSDLYAGGQIGGTRLVSKTCQFKFKDATTCAFVGAGSVCSKLLNDAAGGCLFYTNQHHFGGFVFIDSQSVQQTVVGSPPAKNQLVKIGTTAFKQRAVLNFISGATVVDDPATNSTKVTVTGSNRTYAINVKNDPGLTTFAVGDGVTNDTTAIQSAITLAVSTGRAIYLPSGRYSVSALTGWTNSMTIFGDGMRKSILVARTNGQSVIEVTGSSFHSIHIFDLGIEGFGSGSSSTGHGIYVHDNSGLVFQVTIRNVEVRLCGGRGIFLLENFSTLIDSVSVSDCGGNAIEGEFDNSCTFINCYIHNLASGKAGYRIYSGGTVFIGCNGIDVSTNADWAVLGKSVAGGDDVDAYCRAIIIGCNIEDFTNRGIWCKAGSYISHLSGTSFWAAAGHTTAKAIQLDFVDSDTIGLLDSGCRFALKSGAAWSGGSPIHANNTPFVMLGNRVSGGQYFDTSLNGGAGLLVNLPYISTARNSTTNKGSVFQNSLAISEFDSDLIPSQTNFRSIGSLTKTIKQLHIGEKIQLATGATQVIGANVELTNGDNPILKQIGGTVTGRVQVLNDSYMQIGTDTNHNLLFRTNNLDRWLVDNNGTLRPATDNARDIGFNGGRVKDVHMAGVLYLNAAQNVFVTRGTGSPEGALTGSPGALYIRTDGGANTSLYVKETGTGSTGWIAYGAPGAGGVTGSGTTDKIAKWTSSGAIGNSIASESGTTFTVASHIQADGLNSEVKLTDTTTGSIEARFKVFTNDRVIVGTISNHDLSLFANNADQWRVKASGHFYPEGNGVRDIGATGTRIRTAYFGTSIVSPLLALEPRTDPGSSANGDAWTSSDRNALSIRVAGQTEDAVTSMWRNSAVFSWDTSTAETSMFSDTGVGTKTVAANRLKVGNQVRLKLAGTFGTDVVTPGNFTIKLKNGATTMATISAFGLPAAATDQNWWIEAVGTVATTGASGSIFWTISFYYNDITNTLKTRAYTVNSSTIDTTASKLVDITGQFSASDIDNFWEVVTASIEMVS